MHDINNKSNKKMQTAARAANGPFHLPSHAIITQSRQGFFLLMTVTGHTSLWTTFNSCIHIAGKKNFSRYERNFFSNNSFNIETKLANVKKSF